MLFRSAQEAYIWQVQANFLFGQGDQPGLLNQFIEHECNTPIPLKTTAFELPFTEKELTLTHPQNPSQKLPLKGIIDAVLTDAPHTHALILDYKTGSTLPTAADIKTFRSLQLPLYSLALKKIYPKTHMVGAMIYQLKSQTKLGKSMPFITEIGRAHV